MKYSRWIWGTATLAVLLIVVTLSAVIVARRMTTQAQGRSQEHAQNRQQRPDRPVHSAAWRPNRREFRSLSTGLEVNLLGLQDQTDWIVGAIPVGENEQENVAVGIVHWTDSGASNSRRIERIDRIEEYPSELVEVTSDAVNIRGSDAVASAGTTLVVFLKIRPNAQLRLLQDGSLIRNSNPSFTQRGFAVRNGRPIGIPVNGLHTVLTFLQTDRITGSFGRRAEEVLRNENR